MSVMDIADMCVPDCAWYDCFLVSFDEPCKSLCCNDMHFIALCMILDVAPFT